MTFIFLSLLATVAFGFVLLLVLNYTLVNWENTKINDLASQIKQNNQSTILSKGVASHRFTSVDVSDNLRPSLPHKTFSETAAQFYGKTMTVITTQDYAGWWQKIVHEFQSLREDWQGTLRRWRESLFSLAKPIDSEEDKPVVEREREEKQKEELSSVVERVKDNKRDNYGQLRLDRAADASKTFSLAGMNDTIDELDQDEEGQDYEPEKDYKTQQEATIGLGAGFNTGKTDQDMSQFEKLEKRLLDRLQESGLKNYDIWIQLGDFYLKYHEQEKAKEIFALVLKQASGDQKEVARNRLISF